MAQITKPILTDDTGKDIAGKLDRVVDKLDVVAEELTVIADASRVHKLIINIVSTATPPAEIVNQEVEIYDAHTGLLYAREYFNSPNKLVVNVPNGFNYLIKPKCTTPKHYCTDKFSGNLLNKDIELTITYHSLGDLRTFKDLKAVLDQGLGEYVNIGQEVFLPHPSYTDVLNSTTDNPETVRGIVFEVVNWNEEKEAFTLLSKYIRIGNKQFDAPEALYQFKEKTYAYKEATPSGDESPSDLGWYTRSRKLSTDIEVNYNPAKDYYTYDESTGEYTLVEDLPEITSPSVNGWYDDQYTRTDDTEVVEGTTYYIKNGLTYKSGSTPYYISLKNNIPAGAQLRGTTGDYTIYRRCTTSDHSASIETGTASVNAPTGTLQDIGTIGSGNLNHPDRITYGSNTYGECAVRQWLNSDKPANQWWSPQTQFDRPCDYVGSNGFLYGNPSESASEEIQEAHKEFKETLEIIDTVEVKCSVNSTYSAPDSKYPKSSQYAVIDKFFLVSGMEIFGSALSPVADGSVIFDAFRGATAAMCQKKASPTASASNWWLRSPYSNAYREYNVNDSGSSSNFYSYHSYGVVPACVISKS